MSRRSGQAFLGPRERKVFPLRSWSCARPRLVARSRSSANAARFRLTRRRHVFPTRFRKRDPFNRAIAAHTNGAAEEGITCHLPRNTTAVELEHNFMTRHFAQIGAISHSFFVHLNFSKADFADELLPATAVEIEDCHRLLCSVAQLFYSEKSGEMIPRRYRELTRAHENSGTIFHCPIPVLVLDRIGRRKIFDSVIAK